MKNKSNEKVTMTVEREYAIKIRDLLRQLNLPVPELHEHRGAAYIKLYAAIKELSERVPVHKGD